MDTKKKNFITIGDNTFDINKVIGSKKNHPQKGSVWVMLDGGHGVQSKGAQCEKFDEHFKKNFSPRNARSKI